VPRWLLIAICAFIALAVLWICIHPAFHLAPTAFRYTTFVAGVMLLLRSAFRFARPQLVIAYSSAVPHLRGPDSCHCGYACAFAPLRC
jgi:hypothetical protein